MSYGDEAQVQHHESILKYLLLPLSASIAPPVPQRKRVLHILA